MNQTSPSSMTQTTPTPPTDGPSIAPPPNGSTTSQPPRHPFYTLPAELIFDIIDLLPPDAFINFAFANYPFLHTHGLVPALSRPRVNYITNQTQISSMFPLLRLPAEILLHILHNLKPIDIMRFVVANYQDLSRQGIAPPLTAEMVKQLQGAVQSDWAPG